MFRWLRERRKAAIQRHSERVEAFAGHIDERIREEREAEDEHIREIVREELRKTR